MASTAQLISGIMKFIDAEMLPAMPVNQRWLAGAFLHVAQGKASEMILQYANNPVIAALGLIDDSGAVDLDAVRSAIKSTCQKHGSAEISIPMIGQFTLTEKNFDTLFKYIKTEAGSATE